MSHRTVLIVDDEPTVRFGIRKFLERRGFQIFEAATCADAVGVLAERRPVAAVFDYRLPDGSALDLLEHVRDTGGPTQAIVLTAHGTIDLAVEAMHRGAANFLTKPVAMETLASLVEAISGAARVIPDAEPTKSCPNGLIDPFLGASPAMQTLEERARKVCRSDRPVLILGETGAGKGILARWLHDHSPRRDGPFIDLNCGGLSRDLLESELFGYKAGAFTGALQDKPGLLEVADGGTVFLDEIGDADLRVQTKLLKVLEERRVRRLGEVRERAIDFRLVTATHWDLPERIRSGAFRKDLYYRISILPLMIPSLAERPEDLPLLAEAILPQVAPGRRFELDSSALERLQGHPWPGNVRELRNVLERTTLLASSTRLMADDVHLDDLAAREAPSEEGGAEEEWQNGNGASGKLTLEESEIRHIRRALRETGGNVTRAAERLDIARSSLYEKLRRYGIEPASER